MRKGLTDKFWKDIKKDDIEIARLNRMVDRKQTKELDKWTKRYLKEGKFWNSELSRDLTGKSRSKKSDWL
jgi:hypothetical protein